MITTNLPTIYADVAMLTQLCTDEISILLDTDDRSLIASPDDVRDKEEPTIKNMSGSSCAMLWLKRGT